MIMDDFLYVDHIYYILIHESNRNIKTIFIIFTKKTLCGGEVQADSNTMLFCCIIAHLYLNLQTSIFGELILNNTHEYNALYWNKNISHKGRGSGWKIVLLPSLIFLSLSLIHTYLDATSSYIPV